MFFLSVVYQATPRMMPDFRGGGRSIRPQKRPRSMMRRAYVGRVRFVGLYFFISRIGYDRTGQWKSRRPGPTLITALRGPIEVIGSFRAEWACVYLAFGVGMARVSLSAATQHYISPSDERKFFDSASNTCSSYYRSRWKTILGERSDLEVSVLAAVYYVEIAYPAL